MARSRASVLRRRPRRLQRARQADGGDRCSSEAPRATQLTAHQAVALPHSGSVRVTIRPARLTAACRDERNEEAFASRNEGVESGCSASRPPPARTAESARNMNELHQRPASARLLQRSPIGVVAQIAAGIARQPRRNRARTRRAEQAGERRCAAQRDRPALRNHAALRTEAARRRETGARRRCAPASRCRGGAGARQGRTSGRCPPRFP